MGTGSEVSALCRAFEERSSATASLLRGQQCRPGNCSTAQDASYRDTSCRPTSRRVGVGRGCVARRLGSAMPDEGGARSDELRRLGARERRVQEMSVPPEKGCESAKNQNCESVEVPMNPLNNSRPAGQAPWLDYLKRACSPAASADHGSNATA